MRSWWEEERWWCKRWWWWVGSAGVEDVRDGRRGGRDREATEECAAAQASAPENGATLLTNLVHVLLRGILD
eukprot:5615044-Pleurochrysis_carterae.AAC.1